MLQNFLICTFIFFFFNKINLIKNFNFIIQNLKKKIKFYISLIKEFIYCENYYI